MTPIAQMNNSGDTLKNSPSALAWVLLIARLPLTTSETRPRDPKINTRSAWRKSFVPSETEASGAEGYLVRGRFGLRNLQSAY